MWERLRMSVQTVKQYLGSQGNVTWRSSIYQILNSLIQYLVLLTEEGNLAVIDFTRTDRVFPQGASITLHVGSRFVGVDEWCPRDCSSTRNVSRHCSEYFGEVQLQCRQVFWELQHNCLAKMEVHLNASKSTVSKINE